MINHNQRLYCFRISILLFALVVVRISIQCQESEYWMPTEFITIFNASNCFVCTYQLYVQDFESAHPDVVVVNTWTDESIDFVVVYGMLDGVECHGSKIDGSENILYSVDECLNLRISKSRDSLFIYMVENGQKISYEKIGVSNQGQDPVQEFVIKKTVFGLYNSSHGDSVFFGQDGLLHYRSRKYTYEVLLDPRLADNDCLVFGEDPFNSGTIEYEVLLSGSSLLLVPITLDDDDNATTMNIDYSPILLHRR